MGEFAIGQGVSRFEDPRLIQGGGRYVDDIKLPGMAYGVVLRAQHAHATINALDISAAKAAPGVLAVLTAADVKASGWSDIPVPGGLKRRDGSPMYKPRYPILADTHVRWVGDYVAFVVAETQAQALDAAEMIAVDYDDLPAVTATADAAKPDAPRVWADAPDNICFVELIGDKAKTDEAFAKADRVVKLDTFYPRCHPSPLETCGIVADVNSATGHATLYMTSQAPHAHRTLFAIVAGLPEQNIRIISPDIGGGFGNKVPIYPGYVVATAASLLIGKPVKWVEDRSENLISTGFARDFHMSGEMALRNDGRMLGLRVKLLSDNGAFYADAQPTKFRAGLFHIVTGSYDVPAAHVEADGAYTNKAPGGVAYRCSSRVTEASYLIERLVESAALEMKMDPADIRLKNFIQPDQFPYMSATGFEYDSGNYPKAMQLALDKLGYQELRKEQAEKRKKGELMGIGVASFTEVVGAGPGKHYDIAGLRMFDSAELRVHPTGKAILKLGVKSQGQGHETTFAQIVTEELGIPAADVEVQEGDTDNTPYGLGTYASRSTPVGGAATAMVSRKLRDKAKKIAAHLLEASEADIEFDHGKFFVRGSPSKSKTIQDVAFAAYTNLPDGLEAGLEGVTYYDPPNMTFPFGTYLVVVDIDRGTGQVKVRRMVAVDDCGVRINPMVVEGQIHGGLTEGFGIAFMELITFDEEGNCLGSNFTDYLLPTAWETPRFEMDETVTPSPHHPIGAKGVGESATVGSPAAFVNAVIDAVGHLGIKNIDMPVTSDKVWEELNKVGAAE
jgi:aerobic carbon-monoxide dehydrogenase large subunit